ncbi:MAG: helix-turn-helix transcriptional regulator [Chloroflexi bacterium]|nr:MAG: helix-turn-helix transcriptional regulator [Chloroflexota bacterium]
MKDRPSEDIRIRLGKAVRKRRNELKISQEDFAELAGLHRTYISDLERGTCNISLENIEKLAKALDLSISELMQRVDDQ